MRELKKLTGRMEWLVEALLKMAQLDAGTVVFHPQDTTAAELVRRAAEPLEVPMEVRSIRFTAQAGALLYFFSFKRSNLFAKLLTPCSQLGPNCVNVTLPGTQIAK